MRAIIVIRLEKGGVFPMIKKKELKTRFLKAVFGCFLVMMGIFGAVANLAAESAYAEPVNNSETTEVEEAESTNNGSEANENSGEEEESQDGADGCRASMKPIGWIVCPITEKTADAVDWLYDKIEGILTIDPVSMENGSPIYEVWKYCRGLTNIVFIIFLLVVIYSQITGYGISNYGIKKALPKLIVSAVMVNLSFLICSLMVDASNIVGNSLRGLFTSIAEATTFTGDGLDISFGQIFGSLVGGGALAVGAGMIAFELGAIWMLIPVLLGALVAVASGLITIALRQAVVMLLIMISPLAFVAYILPNTDKWFKKWKDLFFKMLIFYPMFSLLFGASHLAGVAIIASAQNMFGVLLGLAVQIFPLFFCWSLMKMSGTFLGDINTKLRGLAATPLAANRAWAGSHRNLSRQKHLNSSRAYTPSLRLMQFLDARRIGREADTDEYNKAAKNRALARRANRNYRNGIPTRRGEKMYELQAKNMEYERDILRDKNTMNKGLGDYVPAGMVAKKARLSKLDNRNIDASDYLKVEQARGEKIEYDNAVSFHKRMENAINAHMDYTYGFQPKTVDGETVMEPNKKYRFHSDVTRREDLEKTAELAKYNAMLKIMDGNAADVHYAGAVAAQSYDTQKKIVESKMQKYFELTPPTKDLEYRLGELTMQKNAQANIDVILPGLRILNQRGDTDIVQRQMDNILNKNIGGGIELGTHASQALASFLMFEVKDGDPFLRRFGKYINLETARVYNANDRKVMNVTYDEYVKGYHDGEPDIGKYPDGRMYAKKGMKQLAEGTSLDNIERTALSNLDESLKRAYGYKKNATAADWDVEGFLKKREEIQTAFEPAFLSASLKWLSGSEQINSGVKFWTGYEVKQKKDKDGKLVVDENGNPEYDLLAVWDDKDSGFKGHEEEIEKYYRRKTRDYIKDQTTGQILGMRTDYRDAIMEHFAKMFLEDSSEEETSDERKAEYNRARDEIQTRYGDKTPEEAKKLREKDLKELKTKMASAQIRKTLSDTGKLEQIYRTRRSGAANNAKDWWRRWIGLDDEVAINAYLDKNDKRRRREYRETVGNNLSEEENIVAGGFDGVDRAYFATKVRSIYDAWKGFDERRFYEESREWVEKTLGGVSEVILHKYAEYYEANPGTDDHDLMEHLQKLLLDPNNY